MKASQNLKVTWQNVPTRPITAGGVELAHRELCGVSRSSRDYAVLRSGRTFGRRPRAFSACHRSHLAWSASQICASQPVSASR